MYAGSTILIIMLRIPYYVNRSVVHLGAYITELIML